MTATTDTPGPTELGVALSLAGGQHDDAQRTVALTTYRLLAEGAPVTNAAIAAEADTTVEAVVNRPESGGGSGEPGAIQSPAGATAATGL